jgi:hypothetical protein
MQDERRNYVESGLAVVRARSDQHLTVAIERSYNNHPAVFPFRSRNAPEQLVKAYRDDLDALGDRFVLGPPFLEPIKLPDSEPNEHRCHDQDDDMGGQPTRREVSLQHLDPALWLRPSLSWSSDCFVVYPQESSGHRERLGIIGDGQTYRSPGPFSHGFWTDIRLLKE